MAAKESHKTLQTLADVQLVIHLSTEPILFPLPLCSPSILSLCLFVCMSVSPRFSSCSSSTSCGVQVLICQAQDTHKQQQQTYHVFLRRETHTHVNVHATVL